VASIGGGHCCAACDYPACDCTACDTRLPTSAHRPGLPLTVLGAVWPGSGPAAKLVGWGRAFTSLGADVDVVTVTPNRQATATTRAALRQLHERRGESPALLHARVHWSVPLLVPALRRASRAGVCVVVEVPTPTGAAAGEIWASDRTRVARTLRLGVEWCWTPLAVLGADVVVQYCTDRRPWRWLGARRRLTLTNGVDVAATSPCSQWVQRDTCTFVAAGALSHWHGIDRLLAGMAREATSRLLVVGDGPQTRRLQKCVHRFALGERVEFLGVLTGAAYDEVMTRADVGVSTLAEHRRGDFALSPLKARDYLARGLPIIFAGNDPDLVNTSSRPTPYALRQPAGDAPIDVVAVRRWLSHLRAEPTAPNAIRQFAWQRLDYKSRAAAVMCAATTREHLR